MAINIDELRALSPEDKLRLVELLWDDLGNAEQPIPLPDWIGAEVQRRRQEMLDDPTLGISREEMWRRVTRRHE